MKTKIINEMAKEAGHEINEAITKNKDVIIEMLKDSVLDAKVSKKRSDILHFSIIIILILGFFGYAVYSQNKFADFMSQFEYETSVIEQEFDAGETISNSGNIGKE